MKLLPVIDSTILKLLTKDVSKIFELSNAFGSPIHILFPQNFCNNILSFKNVFAKNNVNGLVYFAAKVNRSNVFVKESFKTKIGLDVASENELRAALSIGVKGKNTCMSGPIKDKPFLNLGINVNSTISIDSLEELEIIYSVADSRSCENEIYVLLRWEGTSSNASRFGMNEKEILQAIRSIRANSSKKVILRGFHFHIFGYSIKERVSSIEKLLSYMDYSKEQGLSPFMIDIGGGFPVNYLDQESWDKYLVLKESLNNTSFGDFG